MKKNIGLTAKKKKKKKKKKKTQNLNFFLQNMQILAFVQFYSLNIPPNMQKNSETPEICTNMRY